MEIKKEGIIGDFLYRNYQEYPSDFCSTFWLFLLGLLLLPLTIFTMFVKDFFIAGRICVGIIVWFLTIAFVNYSQGYPHLLYAFIFVVSFLSIVIGAISLTIWIVDITNRNVKQTKVFSDLKEIKSAIKDNYCPIVKWK